MSLLLAGCGGPSASGGDTLIFGRNKDAVTLDFAVAPDGNSLNVARSTAEGLTRYKPGSFDIEPSLATSWTESSDGKSWVFTLRHDVKFHDGTSFDANAVKFNFDRWRFTTNKYHRWGDFAYYASQFGGYPGTIANVKVLAPDRVEFDLTRPVAPLLVDFAMPAFSIASPAAVMSQGQNYFRHPVGTGPYVLDEWVKDDHITLTAFPDYWGVKAKIKTVILRDIPDPSTTASRIAAWRHRRLGISATQRAPADPQERQSHRLSSAAEQSHVLVDERAARAVRKRAGPARHRRRDRHKFHRTRVLRSVCGAGPRVLA